ncbi:23S rRNA (pseudouridine(1915)-N(3))-methyltransferase RlmH [Mesomycoplasma neurolyticum]|uniref:Ribosomal RNA large subunit methyltransferase H n=1 Tax=Mesomycoplasma neurolyticum TaxID=2120 RepID=A0A449A606_9BACT|nr:23S rRNA (pseudouridine(1915)-N(3))-methyltransferase RlmH [Mesomycoplasma neurolyticum]VEU59659.1 Ribosomal RNA large subunit methyltransferase H [Mesomycoplasma neurolyticum]
MKITVICVGDLEQKFREIFDNFYKKITFIAELKITQIKEINDKNIDIKIKKETKLILEKIPKNSLVFLCSLNGVQYDSESFSHFFDNSNLTFVIGGSNGVDEKYFDKKISFSKMTFPHQLFRIMLIEQIYRSLTIKKNIKYHK